MNIELITLRQKLVFHPRAVYALTLRFNPAESRGAGLAKYAQALGTEGFPAVRTYAPVYRNPLLNLFDRTSPVTPSFR